MDIHGYAWHGLLSLIPEEKYLGFDPRVIDEIQLQKGITPLAAATIQGHVRDVELLLKKGADVNKRSRHGITPLLFAAWRTTENRAPIIRLLLEHGADVDATCAHAQYNTPLMLIILETRPIDIESLLELRKKGASLTDINAERKTALDLAEMTKIDDVINAIEHPPEPNDGTVMSAVAEWIISLPLYISFIIQTTWVGLVGASPVR